MNSLTPRPFRHIFAAPRRPPVSLMRTDVGLNGNAERFGLLPLGCVPSLQSVMCFDRGGDDETCEGLHIRRD